MGKILRINLHSNSIKTENLGEEDLKKFIGGVGLAAKIIYDEVNPEVDPLSSENKLVFMTGPLTGTLVPCTGRYVVCAKSPLTNTWGESHSSGFWARELKRAGYDGIIVEGRSEKPSFLVISDEEVDVKDAGELWGMGSLETEEILKKRLGEDFRIACIGPAGERLVRFASILNDEGRVAGRSGMGAVMGSKNLKAIAVKGTREIPVKDPERIKSILRRIYPQIMSFPTTQIFASYGTSGEMMMLYEYGDIPIKNFMLGKWEKISSISGETYNKMMVKGKRACWNCPISCWRYVKIEDGPFAGLELKRGPEYETLASLGSLLLNDRLDVIVKANHLCNHYGMDTISTGVCIAFSIECYEKGIITGQEKGDLNLEWGNPETILKLIEFIGERKGLGNILAEGVKRASEIIGKGSEKLAMHVKGLEIPMHDPRAFKGMGLQYAVSNRGACHLQGLIHRIEQGERMPDLKIYERLNRFDVKDKGRVLAALQNWHEILESLIICKFLGIAPGHIPGLYTLVTGIPMSLEKLLEAGERIYTLKRMFNVRCGITREDDTLPYRLTNERLEEGGTLGNTISPEELNMMLNEYYMARGWDERGVPKDETLKNLGLHYSP
ncbi:MAG: aldehyde ferredoxin oxidoreductase family protein [Candidatus Bathyarchaeota archaeon]|nr:aldehyde ferredoxin oxidoreductase family protein [Candidatus Bathyarchaeota archaeon]